MKVPTVTRSPLSHRSVGGFFSKTGSEIFFENGNRLYSAGCNLLKIICFVSLWGEVSRIGKIIAKGVAFCIWTIQVYAYMYTYMCTYMFDFHRMNGSQSYENIPVPWILWGWNLWVMFLNQRCGEEIISPWVVVDWYCLFSIPIWGRFPFWRSLFFNWVGSTTNQTRIN